MDTPSRVDAMALHYHIPLTGCQYVCLKHVQITITNEKNNFNNSYMQQLKTGTINYIRQSTDFLSETGHVYKSKHVVLTPKLSDIHKAAYVLQYPYTKTISVRN